MEREQLLEIEYHWREHNRHIEERRRILKTPPEPAEVTPDVSMAERFDAAFARIEPLIRPVKDGPLTTWDVTPEVPITGVVEGEEITVKLSFNVQGNSIHPWVNSNLQKPYAKKGVDGLWISRNWCAANDEGNTDDAGSVPRELAHIEELLDVYFAELAKMTPEQLEELGIPAPKEA